MDSYNAFFEYATSLGVKRFTVFPPKQGLSQARRGRVLKPNDFGCPHHHSKEIAVLFLNHQESLADMWPGGPEAVIASRNAVVVSRQIAEHFRATRLGINR
jgi:hypothetical protein